MLNLSSGTRVRSTMGRVTFSTPTPHATSYQLEVYNKKIVFFNFSCETLVGDDPIRSYAYTGQIPVRNLQLRHAINIGPHVQGDNDERDQKALIDSPLSQQ